MKRNRMVSSDMRKPLLGLLVGLAAWGVLNQTGLLLFDIYSWPFWVQPAIIFLSGTLAGYAAGRGGLILGGVIGLVDFAFLLGLLHAASELLDYFEDPIYLFAFVGVGFCILPGLLGGYLGGKLARIRRRRSSSPDQKLTDSRSP